jgi:hypothetical protein
MATALFVTEEKIKSFTLVDDNMDPGDLYPFVLQAQDFWIQQTTGTKLYDKLKQLVIDNVQSGTPIPADYDKLLNDYVVPTVLHYAVYQALPSIKFKATNKGIMSGTSEVSSQVSLGELQYLRDNIFSSAKFYNERLRDYLRDYSELYIEYRNYTYKDGMPPQHKTSYYTGLAIPKKTYGRFDDCDLTDGACNPPIY